MTPRETLQDLAEFFTADPALEVASVARPAGGDENQEARVLNLAGDAEGFFRDVIRKEVVDQLTAWSLTRFDPVYKPEQDSVEWFEVTDVGALRLAVDRFANLGPLQPFISADESYTQRLLYRVYVLTGARGRKAYFFRAFSSAAELQRKRGTAALVSRDGTFTKVEERIFLFDDRIDCFVFGDYVFVLRRNDYRRIFDQLDEVRRRARDAASALHAKVPIANFDDFAAACSTQAAMADKLLAVQRRDYFDRLSYEMLAPVITEFNLQIPVQELDGVPQLVFLTEPEHRWRILRLVDDDYLRSAMTDHLYEANSKIAPPS